MKNKMEQRKGYNSELLMKQVRNGDRKKETELQEEDPRSSYTAKLFL